MTESNDDKREYDGLGRLPEDCSEAISAACERVLSGDRFASAIDFLASKAREAAEQTDSAPQGTWQWSAGRIVACLSSALLQQLEAVATLRAERDELAARLKPFSDAITEGDGTYVEDQPDEMSIWDTDIAEKLTLGDFRRARAALNRGETE